MDDDSQDVWRPAQYSRFRDERAAPFFDLLGLVRPCPGGSVVDLGCGTGALTRHLHSHTEASETVGIDRSESMLRESAAHSGDGLRFELGDIAAFAETLSGGLDVIFSNAALQWVPGHASLLPSLAGRLKPGGQLAVQMPRNDAHPSHALASEVARLPEFARALDGYERRDPLPELEWYARELARLGFAEQHAREQVYVHELEGPEDVLEWVKGTLLTDYQRRLSAEEFEHFLAAYQQALREALPDERPYVYPFRRVLIWGQKG